MYIFSYKSQKLSLYIKVPRFEVNEQNVVLAEARILREDEMTCLLDMCRSQERF